MEIESETEKELPRKWFTFNIEGLGIGKSFCMLIENSLGHMLIQIRMKETENEQSELERNRERTKRARKKERRAAYEINCF